MKYTDSSEEYHTSFCNMIVWVELAVDPERSPAYGQRFDIDVGDTAAFVEVNPSAMDSLSIEEQLCFLG